MGSKKKATKAKPKSRSKAKPNGAKKKSVPKKAAPKKKSAKPKTSTKKVKASELPVEPQGKVGVKDMTDKWIAFGPVEGMGTEKMQQLAQETFDRGLELEDVLVDEEFQFVANALAKAGWAPKISEQEQADMDFESAEAEPDFDDAGDDSQMEMDMDEDEGYF